MPLNILKELGGWASYEMVQRYAHLAPEHLAEFAGNANVAKSVLQPIALAIECKLARKSSFSGFFQEEEMAVLLI